MQHLPPSITRLITPAMIAPLHAYWSPHIEQLQWPGGNQSLEFNGTLAWFSGAGIHPLRTLILYGIFFDSTYIQSFAIPLCEQSRWSSTPPQCGFFLIFSKNLPFLENILSPKSCKVVPQGEWNIAAFHFQLAQKYWAHLCISNA